MLDQGTPSSRYELQTTTTSKARHQLKRNHNNSNDSNSNDNNNHQSFLGECEPVTEGPTFKFRRLQLVFGGSMGANGSQLVFHRLCVCVCVCLPVFCLRVVR